MRVKKAAPLRLQLDAPWGSAFECFVFVAERLTGTDRLDTLMIVDSLLTVNQLRRICSFSKPSSPQLQKSSSESCNIDILFLFCRDNLTK